MSSEPARVNVPLVHGLVLLFVVGATLVYGVLFSETLLGVSVVWLAVSLYLLYLGNRLVLAAERLAYEP